MTLLLLESCSEGPEIIRDFGFTVQVLPYHTLVYGLEEQELGFRIICPGHWDGASYNIRWFTASALGSLRSDSGLAMEENVTYSLPSTEFTLVYTPSKTGKHDFTIWISDVFGKEERKDLEIEYK